VEAALNAGMKAIVITILHKPDEFKTYPNVIRFANDFTELNDMVVSKNSLQQILS
jgi:beta-phosphoglucomutase